MEKTSGKVSSEDIEAFVQIFEASDWNHVEVEFDDFALHLSKQREERSAGLLRHDLGGRNISLPTKKSAPLSQTSAPPAATASIPSVNVPDGWLTIRAPHLGTFYRATKPGAPPLIDVGQAVDVDSEVCLLEVMKLFTTLRAGASGILRKICAVDSQLVEAGDILFLIEP